ncbi:MAG: hypothetical protein KatS3mg076_1452 [Candidatus Binatia bacterium]|nr:MAG: hypothetical protein KatS3mg076_1452 [Candidatus Binatia bacterium]
MKVSFPSLEFFEALRQKMQEARSRFERLGYFDTRFGIRVFDPRVPGGRRDFVLGFEVFDCVEVRESPDVLSENLDFVLAGDIGAWAEMFRNIKENGRADVAHSINTLTHFGEKLRVLYDDPDGHDKLYRFAESVQEFFDLASSVDFDLPSLPAEARAAQEGPS